MSKRSRKRFIVSTADELQDLYSSLTEQETTRKFVMTSLIFYNASIDVDR